MSDPEPLQNPTPTVTEAQPISTPPPEPQPEAGLTPEAHPSFGVTPGEEITVPLEPSTPASAQGFGEAMPEPVQTENGLDVPPVAPEAPTSPDAPLPADTPIEDTQGKLVSTPEPFDSAQGKPPHPRSFLTKALESIQFRKRTKLENIIKAQF